MNSKELITELSKQLNWTAKDVTEMLSAMSQIVGSKLVENDAISLTGFGQFEVKRKAETSPNPEFFPPDLIVENVAELGRLILQARS